MSIARGGLLRVGSAVWRSVGAAVVLAVTVVGAGPAGSAPARSTQPVGSAVTSTGPVGSAAISTGPVIDELAEGRQDADVAVQVAGPLQVNQRRLTFQPGASTGKHCHYGRLIGVVESGTLTHYAPIYPGGVHVYRAGDALNEGPGYVHEGVNEGTEPLVLYVTYITPVGKPLAETDLTKCDPARGANPPGRR